MRLKAIPCASGGHSVASLPTYGQTVNEQIRELGMQLLECEAWFAQAATIMSNINALVGQREQLPKGGPKLGRS